VLDELLSPRLRFFRFCFSLFTSGSLEFCLSFETSGMLSESEQSVNLTSESESKILRLIFFFFDIKRVSSSELLLEIKRKIIYDFYRIRYNLK